MCMADQPQFRRHLYSGLCYYRKMEALDSMTQKIVVKATDDVYQTTRDKLAVKNEESLKNR